MSKSLLSKVLLLGTIAMSSTAWAAEYFIANRDTAGLAGAIRHANASPQADTIHLADGGLYAFSTASEAGLALPPVQGRLTVMGHGAEIRRNTEQALALLEVVANSAGLPGTSR